MEVSQSFSKGFTYGLICQSLNDRFETFLYFCEFSEINDYQSTTYIFHPREKKYFDGLFLKRARSYQIGRYAAKRAVAALTGEKEFRTILVEKGIFDQPVVTCRSQQNIQVSITHCDGLGAAIAFLENYPMGIDIERINPGHNKLLESQLTEQEKRLINTLHYPYQIALTLFWTSKEALSKVLRTGLTTPLNIYEVSKVEVCNKFIICYYKYFTQYLTVSFVSEPYVCSLTFPKNIKIDLEFHIKEIRNNLDMTLGNFPRQFWPSEQIDAI
ncbi:4'-phosphopantetheinyl transferase [Candidatus Desulfosporosinus infrequens]|uniref:4'-phosphopantetheinyl transferase n=1 Tax=Candidatus Desulfosporosinus infrequens TaxID=2043169 RepID=A0A2U3L622_9FIRM|nr:4'-phosphopantetheinyl transferase [Candidatus Desulfosporosinus infrequens]